MTCKRNINSDNINVDIGNVITVYYYNLVLSILAKSDFNHVLPNVNFFNNLATHIDFNIDIYNKFNEQNITFESIDDVYKDQVPRLFYGYWFWHAQDKVNEKINIIMKPLMNHLINEALVKSNLVKNIEYPVIHFRCADAPFIKNPHYYLQRYEYFKKALEYINSKSNIKYNKVILLSCVTHLSNEEKKKACVIYANELKKYIESLKYEVIMMCSTNLDDFSTIFYAPGVISTSSSFSFMSGYFGNGVYVQPSILNIEKNTDKCSDCDDWVIKGYNVNHNDVNDYHDTDKVIGMLKK